MRAEKHHLSPILATALLAAAAALIPACRAKTDEMLPLKIKVGEKAPDFTLPAADGSKVELSSFRGHNVLIDFYRGYW